jgi:hypothetical protein
MSTPLNNGHLRTAPSLPIERTELNLSDTMNSTRNPQDKKTLKIGFLENENRNLAQMAEDLQTTLSINKNIIKSLLEQRKGANN